MNKAQAEWEKYKKSVLDTRRGTMAPEDYRKLDFLAGMVSGMALLKEYGLVAVDEYTTVFNNTIQELTHKYGTST